jgi:thiamine-phosphate pyrophosphorylase
MATGRDQRLLALESARLYFVCEGRPRGADPSPLLGLALRGGAGIVQLREKSVRSDDELIALAGPFRRAADQHDALFILNDRPDLVEACGADGVHVGQDDDTPASARALVGPDRIVGRSTHAPDQAAAADADPDVDYLAVGPVHETPTKPGRPAAGLHYVAHAASSVAKPWFAIGGLDAGNVHEVIERGATRIVVVRAITEADDPEAAARALREALTRVAA